MGHSSKFCKREQKKMKRAQRVMINTIDEYSPQLWNGLPYKTERDP